jgi:putative endonuclease
LNDLELSVWVKVCLKEANMGSGFQQERQLRSRSLGRYGEDIAARYLQAGGLVLIDRNWRGPSGEIDLVALDGDTLVICEVKTRTTDMYGGALAAVDARKLARLRRLAIEWLQDHPLSVVDIRVDVVAVWRGSRGPAKIQHLAGVQ